ncbi:MAG: hypothetical protein M3Q72_00610, partial [Actinomycetota bacterium]|nr:hypothetical protein [Actinomycetota bacterium]
AIAMRIGESGGEGLMMAFARTDSAGAARVVTVVASEPATIELPDGSWHDVLVDGSSPRTASVTTDGTRPVVLHRRSAQ